jgi:single-strand DNA-binding protein
MSNDVNSVVLVGRLTADPELAQAGSTPVLRMRIAVNRDKKVGNEWVEQGHFFNADMFGARAEGLSKHLAKGSRVAIQGHLEFRQWEAKDGSKRSAVQIMVEQLNFADSRGGGQQQSLDGYQERAERYERDVERVPGRSDIPTDEVDDDDLDSDIPFLWEPYVERAHTHNPFAVAHHHAG